MATMIKAVILDFDDTLCLTEEICFNLENEVLAKMGRPPIDRKIHLKTWGKPLFEIINTRSPGVDVTEFERLYEGVIRKYIEEGLFDNIPEENMETLRELAKQGLYLAVVTTRTEGEVKHLLGGEHPLTELIRDFYHKDNTKYRKPDPRAFEEVLTDNKLNPSECVYVGDSLGDAESALGAGMYFIASLESGLRYKADFEKYDVSAYIYDFPELLGALQKLDKEVGTEL